MPDISSIPTLTRCATLPPDRISREFQRKAALYSLASKVALFAILTISTLVLAIGLLGAQIVPAGAGFGLFGLALSLPVWMHWSTKWAQQSSAFRIQAFHESQIANRLSEHPLPEPEIQSWLQRHEIVQSEFLNSIALRRLIARVDYFADVARTGAQETKAVAYDLGLPFEIREHIHLTYETHSLPYILEAALNLHLIRHPESEATIASLGRITPKSLGERNCSKNSPYFHCFDGRPPLSFEMTNEIALGSGNSLNQLRQALFEPPEVTGLSSGSSLQPRQPVGSETAPALLA